ncbi:MAG: GTPase [Bacteroidota bacterium]|nr:GTPase [Bacteroidota bacterium]
MKFIDLAKITVKSGDGGKGHISFRREKFVPKGGPDGGNGGDGGDVVIIAEPHLSTLLDFKYKSNYTAENGKEGGKNRCTGKNGKSIIIKVPCGTVIKDPLDEDIIADLAEPKAEFIIAPGGKGGRGNSEFATSTNQSPRYADPGLPGEEREIILELKLIADVGIVGYPNVGKSTLISVISAAKPKIADYPFTTLIPNLGIVKVAEGKSFTVADIPGLIEGASEGKGLGHQFLRHVERTSSLLFMLDCLSENPLSDYNTLRSELKKYNPDMLKKKMLLCFCRVDTIDEDRKAELKKIKFPGYSKQPLLISSVSGENIDMIKKAMWKTVEK